MPTIEPTHTGESSFTQQLSPWTRFTFAATRQWKLQHSEQHTTGHWRRLKRDNSRTQRSGNPQRHSG